MTEERHLVGQLSISRMRSLEGSTLVISEDGKIIPLEPVSAQSCRMICFHNRNMLSSFSVHKGPHIPNARVCPNFQMPTLVNQNLILMLEYQALLSVNNFESV